MVLEATTDSNLQEFLTTREIGRQTDGYFEPPWWSHAEREVRVSGTVAVLTDVSVDNGARVEVTGSVDDVTLSANNGAQLDGEALEATTAEVDADNGAQMTVCVTER